MGRPTRKFLPSTFLFAIKQENNIMYKITFVIGIICFSSIAIALPLNNDMEASSYNVRSRRAVFNLIPARQTSRDMRLAQLSTFNIEDAMQTEKERVEHKNKMRTRRKLLRLLNKLLKEEMQDQGL